MAGNRKWRSFLNKFHVYGGLFSVGFLITFGISAFYHQHHPKFPKPGDKTTYWEASFTTPQITENIDFKKAIRDSLGLFGHTPWWEDYHDSLGVHHFSIARPGKRYWITVPLQDDVYKVKEIRMGPWPVLIALHPLAAGMMNHGKGPFFIKTWRIVSVPMALVLFCVILITIHYWYVRSFRKRRSWIIVGAIASFPVILLIFIWLVG
jgi:hypothetical protein